MRIPRRPFLPALAVAALCAAPAAGCAPSRARLSGEEGRSAIEFFARAPGPDYPFTASFSGVAEARGRAVPFVAGARSAGPAEEVVGIYDPLGRPILFISNDGARLSVSRGDAAQGLPAAGLPIPADGAGVFAGPLSIARVLSGAPGYPVGPGGEAAAGEDGAWVFADARQEIRSDPSRRAIVRAEYRIAGKRIVVTYPGRDGAGPPDAVAVEAGGVRIDMRRDRE